jgi:hypothetical protein
MVRVANGTAPGSLPGLLCYEPKPHTLNTMGQGAWPCRRLRVLCPVREIPQGVRGQKGHSEYSST